jgi:hypothetical protein
MNTAKAMKQQGLRYFSSLTPVQRDKTIYFIVKEKLGLGQLADGLAKVIMSEMLTELIKTRELVDNEVKKQKCFNYKGTYYPLNISEILKTKQP